jgi:Trypsin-like peptidase domain
MAIVALFATLGGLAGREIGRLLRLSAGRGALRQLDRFGGAATAALGALIVCWLAAGLLVGTTALSLSSAIGNSRILTAIDAIMPPLPSVEAKVQALLRSTDFPSVFAQVVAPSVPSATTATRQQMVVALGTASGSILKVTAFDRCGGAHEGTAFAVGAGEFVTAAHVVAGARVVDVGAVAATVVLFDARHDVAVLRTGSPGPPALLVLPSSAPPDTPAAVAGFPLNRSFQVVPAAIAGTISALGRDIYNSALVERKLVVVSAQVQPGNSGSPVMVGGAVSGMVFSRSLSQSRTAYAVAPATIRADVARATDAPAATGACLSG